jgi:hypothetical protein
VLNDLDAAHYVQLSEVPGRFAILDEHETADTSWLLTSADGLNWTRAGHLAATVEESLGGAAGLFVTYSAQPNDVWRTTDGATWTPAQADGGIPYGAAAIPGGGYIAQAFDTLTIIKSTDGSVWSPDQGDLKGRLGLWPW